MKRPNINWPAVWIAIALLLFWMTVCGCVTVNKETNVYVIDPVIQVEVEVK